MKKILVMLLVTGVLLSCNPGADKKNAITDPSIETQVEHEEKAAVLTLNNGAKWKTDATTLSNVALLKTIVSNARNESPGNYLQTAKRLESGVNMMVIECKMKGENHEALHHWLEPLIESIQELGKASSIQNATTTFGEIENQLNRFAAYFD